MIIDQLIVAFKAEGADKLLNTIDTISKKVVSATNKAIMEEARLETQRAKTASLLKKTEIQEKLALFKIENEKSKSSLKILNAEAKKDSDLSKRKIKNKKEEDDYFNKANKVRQRQLIEQQKAHQQRDAQRKKREVEYQKWWEKALAKRDREEARQAKAREKEIANRSKLEAQAMRDSAIATKLKIAGTASLLYGIGRSAFGALKWTDNKTINATRRVASYVGAGMSGARVEGLEGSLARWGGQPGEGLGTVRSINAQLGAMKFGDTSLVETLGKFGIGGIGTQSTPTDVLKAVMRRVQTLGKDSSESFALMSAMGFSDAMMKIMQEGDEKALEREGVMLSVEEKILKTNQESFNAVKELEKSTLDIAEKTNFIRDIRNLLIKQFPNAAASLDLATSVGGGVALGGILKYISNWRSSNTALSLTGSLSKSTGTGFLLRGLSKGLGVGLLGEGAMAISDIAIKSKGIDPNNYSTIMAHKNAMYAQGQSAMNATQAIRDIIDLFKDKPSNTQQPNVSSLEFNRQENIIGLPENAMTYLNFGTK